jgi:hypothetical protein
MDVADRWERWGPVSGLPFVVSFLALFFLFFVPGDELPADVDAAQIAEYYRGRGEAGFLLMYSLVGPGGVALLWFTAALRASLRRAEPSPSRLSAAVLLQALRLGGMGAAWQHPAAHSSDREYSCAGSAGRGAVATAPAHAGPANSQAFASPVSCGSPVPG